MAAEVDRRGRAVLLWSLLWTFATTLVTDLGGMRYLQWVIWPTDLYALQRLNEAEGEAPVDLAMIGSSRVSYGLSPSMLDPCLSQRLGRPVRSQNLGRAFTTAWSWRSLVEGTFGQRRPRALLVGMEPEALNGHNHQLSRTLSTETRWSDLPANLGAVRDLHQLYGALWPLFRGPEALGIQLSGMDDEEGRLRWMALHQGGGQWCSGSAACEEANAQLNQIQVRRWRYFMSVRQEKFRAERFGDYVLEGGSAAAAFEELLDWAAQEPPVRVVVLELPFHPVYEELVPSEVQQAYQAWLEAGAARRGYALIRLPQADWHQDRDYWTDPDHLNDWGAEALATALCPTLAQELIR
jgi:hypothetical protein